VGFQLPVYLLVHPLFYTALVFSAQVSLHFVLQVGCGGGLQENSMAADRLSLLSQLSSGGLGLGLALSMLRVCLGNFEISPFSTGVTIVWGEPLVATAIKLAGLCIAIQVFEFFASTSEAEQEEQPKAKEIVDQEEEPEQPATSAAPATCAKKLAGVAETLKTQAGHAPVLMMALLCAQLTPSQDTLNLLLPLRWFFLLSVAGLYMQIGLAVIHAAFHWDTSAPLDQWGALRWDLQSAASQKMLNLVTKGSLYLTYGGTWLGMISLGIMPWIVVKVLTILAVYPVLSADAKQNLSDGLELFTGVLGAHYEAYLASRRKAEEEAARRKAAAFDAELEKENKRKNSTMNHKASDGGAQKMSPQKSSPQKAKAAPKAGKKKKN